MTNPTPGSYTAVVADSLGVILEADAVTRAVRRIAAEVIERVEARHRLAVVGIRRGGVALSERIAAEVGTLEGRAVPTGTVDIALYRDDAAMSLPSPKIGPTSISFDVEGRDVLLVDDVLQTGRTVRAAIDCLLDYGRPRRIWYACLVDRGGRELPVAPDFCGKRLEADSAMRLSLRQGELDRLELIATPRGGVG